MRASKHHHHSLEEYLQIDEGSRIKHEYFDGQVYAMSGASPEHAALTVSLGGELREKLRGRPCRVFSPDLYVRIAATGDVVHPDVTVVCRPIEFDPADAKKRIVTNPIVIAEILSPSTEKNDRGERFEDYKQIPSLRHVLFVAQDTVRIELWSRNARGAWMETPEIFGSGSRLAIPTLELELDVDEIYRDPLTER